MSARKDEMDTKIFDVLEKKVEKLVGRLRSLEQENEKLRVDLGNSRRSERDAADARGTIERLEKDQHAVRERLEKLLQSLEGAEPKS